jgi:hypothetical protein
LNCTSTWANGFPPAFWSLVNFLKQAGSPVLSFVTFSADHPAGRSLSARACALTSGTAGLVLVGVALGGVAGELAAAEGELATGEVAEDEAAAGVEAPVGEPAADVVVVAAEVVVAAADVGSGVTGAAPLCLLLEQATRLTATAT